MPLGSGQPMPSALLPMSGQGLPDTRPDLLLTIIVRNRRTRPNDPVPSTSLPFKQAPLSSAPMFPPVRSKILPSLPPPLLAPSLPPPVAAANDDNAPYSPGSSPEELGGNQAPQSGDLGLTEKLARLQAEVAAKRAALAMREQDKAPEPPLQQPLGGFFGQSQSVGMYSQSMPSQAPPIQPPPFISTSANQPPFPFPLANKPMGEGGGSSLSRMSDADLLAAAAAMEQPPVKRTLPPPGLKDIKWG